MSDATVIDQKSENLLDEGDHERFAHYVNKTDMTKKYEHIWEVEGAVDPSVGGKRVTHEICNMYRDPEFYQGKFINCEDGLQIPW